MSNEKLLNTPIPEIPPDEKALKEGIMNTIRLEGRPIPFTFKYVLTEKGIWALLKKMPLLKQRTEFIAYDTIEFYEVGKHQGMDCLILHPKEREAMNKVFFDDHEGVISVIDRYIRIATDDDFIDEEEEPSEE
jgi:hypothetical protein